MWKSRERRWAAVALLFKGFQLGRIGVATHGAVRSATTAQETRCLRLASGDNFFIYHRGRSTRGAFPGSAVKASDKLKAVELSGRIQDLDIACGVWLMSCFLFLFFIPRASWRAQDDPRPLVPQPPGPLQRSNHCRVHDVEEGVQGLDF